METLDFPLLGYKSLRAVNTNWMESHDWDLTSPIYSGPHYDLTIWYNGRLQAECLGRSSDYPHDPPGRYCDCGIYGTFSLRDATSYLERFWRVAGTPGDPVYRKCDGQPLTVLGEPVCFVREAGDNSYRISANLELLVRAEGRSILHRYYHNQHGGWRAEAASIEAIILPLKPTLNQHTYRYNAQYACLPTSGLANDLYEETVRFAEFFSQKFGVPILTRRQAANTIRMLRRKLHKAEVEWNTKW